MAPKPHESMQVPGNAERVVPLPPLDHALTKVSGCRLGVSPREGHLTEERVNDREAPLGIDHLTEDKGRVEAVFGSVVVLAQDGHPAFDNQDEVRFEAVRIAE